MGVVASVGGRTMGFQYPFSLPLLQGIGCPAYQLTELFGRICVVHTYFLTHFNMFVNTVHRLLHSFDGNMQPPVVAMQHQLRAMRLPSLWELSPGDPHFDPTPALACPEFDDLEIEGCDLIEEGLCGCEPGGM